MSLINQMLQDLDKRGSDTLVAEPMYAHIRTVDLPPARRWWLLALPGALLFALLAWLLWQQFLPAAARRMPPKASVLATAAPAPVSLPAQAPVASANAESLPPMNDLPLLLKLSSELENPHPAAPMEVEKNTPAPVLARIEKVLPEQPEKIEKKKAAGTAVAPVVAPAVASVLQAKSSEHGAAASKFVKETSPQQQAEGEYRQATHLQQQGRSSEAIILLERALKSDTQHAAARQSLIGLLLENKRHDEAMRNLQQALSLDQNQPGLAMILARLQVEKGSLPLAIETLQRSLPHALERADYLAFLAALQQRGSHHKEAVDLYRRALKQNPQNGLWWMGLGISLQADGRVAEAQDAYGRAKSTNGLSPELLAFVEQKLAALQP